MMYWFEFIYVFFFLMIQVNKLMGYNICFIIFLKKVSFNDNNKILWI